MLLTGFLIQFWSIPQKGISKNDLAAQRIARMEASIVSNSVQQSESKPNTSNLTKSLKETQKKQMQYLTILAMILGIGSLGYSFLKKKELE